MPGAGTYRTIRPSNPNRERIVRAYLVVTGVLFVLLTVAHLWRMAAESAALARDPFFLLITVASASLAVWAWRLFRAPARS